MTPTSRTVRWSVDPTEGALYVLAQKGGVDVKQFRESHPRIASVPFDSDYKFMATFHTMPGGDAGSVVRAYVKGAPDVILGRSTSARVAGGQTQTLTDDMRAKVMAENDRLAGQGKRVLALAQREFDPASFDPAADLMTLMQDLEMSALVSEVDPPRAEAKTAIATAKRAGVRVRMITGDFAVTAEAIAQELGIEGRAVTGAEFAALSDEEADEQVDDIGVIGRVAPEHKVRLVEVLKRKHHVVAMTGDGVNDAPAIGAADIGIAMGITGTDVAKGAAKMILADDNFATIVAAVEEGRVVYDNLQKFLRIQIANLFMFILAFLGSTAFSIAGTALLIPSQVLWIHMAVVAPIGAVMGLDAGTPGIMERKPRPFNQAIIPTWMMVRLVVSGLFMAAAALILVQIGKTTYDSLQVGQTMALVGLSLMNIFLALNLRFPEESAFGRATLSNPKLLWAFAWAVMSSMLITQIRVLQGPLPHGRVDRPPVAHLSRARCRLAGTRRTQQGNPAGAPAGSRAGRLGVTADRLASVTPPGHRSVPRYRARAGTRPRPRSPRVRPARVGATTRSSPRPRPVARRRPRRRRPARRRARPALSRA